MPPRPFKGGRQLTAGSCSSRRTHVDVTLIARDQARNRGGNQMAVRIGTSEHGGTFYTQGQAFAELFNRGRPESDRAVVLTTDASIHNAEQLDRGNLEFGFMASNWIGRAKNA